MPADAVESLPDLFGAVSRRLRHAAMSALAPWQIAPSHSRAIAVIAQYPSVRLSELAEHLRIAPRSVTEVVDSLEERGLVRRTPDPDDRRATLVSLTPEGQRVSAAVREARAAEAEAIFGRLNAADRAHLRRILAQLTIDSDAPEHRAPPVR